MRTLSRSKLVGINGALLLCLLVTAVAATLTGPAPLSLKESWSALATEHPYHQVLLRVRLPRVLLAIIVGAGLATSGLVLQALLRNPLACAHILGVSGGASLGGIAGLMFFPALFATRLKLGAAEISPVPLAAFAGALLSMVLIQRFALVHGRLHPYHLLLSGVIFNTFVSALIMFLNSVLDFYQAQSLLFWLMGSLSTTSYFSVALTWLYVLLGFVWKYRHGVSLNLLSLGEESALQLGVEVNRVRRHLFIACSLVVGAIVAVSGMIGFVGLMVPHVLRLLLGNDHRLLLPASFLAGGIFLGWADTLARVVLAPVELPVGVVTAFFGAPFFFFLLYHEGRKRVLYEPGR
ncbi:MAG TPA: iron ABC transporter permease [Candidatus Acidoferrales bacterium]|nr:iron ABC transporter permease [Candidatus Acidoferrales bacterium]